MSNTKKYESIIREIHEEWAVKNGYRLGAASKVDSGKLRMQRAAHRNDLLDAKNSEHFVESAKPQASSVRLQAKQQAFYM